MFGIIDELQNKIEILESEKQNNICKNCKHWKKNEKEVTASLNIGTCTFVEMFWDSTEWKIENYEGFRVLKEENINKKAFIQDGSDYHAELITKENFGCNQFDSVE